MKLKTLKDIEPVGHFDVDRKNLKKEAIKWVKEWKKEIEDYKPKDHSMDWHCSVLHEKIESFKKFHNVSEEDLK